jgi:hypothetical protein
VRRLTVLLMLLLGACQAKIKHVGPTEVMVRIYADDAVREASTRLRVHTSTQSTGRADWVDHTPVNVELEQSGTESLAWQPVDIPVIPADEGHPAQLFEIVVEALDPAGVVLVEQRALTSFIKQAQIVITLSLARCGEQPLGVLCENDARCHGSRCQTCLAGACSDTQITPPEQLPTLKQELMTDAGRPLSDSTAVCIADSCELPHAVATCSGDACLIVSCNAPYLDCDEDPHNGCEADLSSTEHCGSCNAPCRFGNAQALCVEGQCLFDGCKDSYGDCDKDQNNGCERPLDNLEDCGSCGVACSKPAHATAVCQKGHCGGDCEPGYGDCNNKLSDGCEQSLTDVTHCGACNTQCGGHHVSVSDCKNGRCFVGGCETGFADCNGDPSDGCEVDLASPEHCGSCEAVCSLSNVAKQRCNVSGTSPFCEIDRSPCPGTSCTSAQQDGCKPGFADCDGKFETGCETDLKKVATCGACDNSCMLDNTMTECQDGACATVGCISGYGRCGDSVVCRSLQSDLANCGMCGRTCPTGQKCIGGSCSALVCDPGRADCDGTEQNGCEANLKDVSHCGGCGLSCTTLPQTVSAICDGTNCKITSCATGFADCDGSAANGCEASLASAINCGSCGIACSEGKSCINRVCDYCSSSEHCGRDQECCSSHCVSTAGICSKQSCLLRLGREIQSSNCGGCGITCTDQCCDGIF